MDVVFLGMQLVGFNILKSSPLRLALFSVNTTVKVYTSYNYIYCDDTCLYSSLKTSWLFYCCDGGSNIKTVETKENGRYVSRKNARKSVFIN